MPAVGGPAFSVGEQVFWDTARAFGTATRRFGTVIVVVPSRQHPSIVIGVKEWRDLLQTARYDSETESIDEISLRQDARYNMSREGWSYIVSVDTPKSRGRKRLYWPRANTLRPVEDL
jgi:hypothetical protein